MGGIAKPMGLDSGKPNMGSLCQVSKHHNSPSTGTDFYECLAIAKATEELDLQFPQAPVSHQ